MAPKYLFLQALGNHEFDIGVEGLVPFLKAVNFSVISANINAAKEPAMKNLFSKSVERTVAGQRVGIVGYTTVDTPSISSSGQWSVESLWTLRSPPEPLTTADQVSETVTPFYSGTLDKTTKRLNLAITAT